MTATATAAPTVEVVTVTPDIARMLLDANTRNRKLRPARVRQFSDAMTRGEWQFNGDAIRVSEDDELLDGQHKLAAVEDSGCPQQFVMVTGLPASSQETMDSGAKRSVADMLSLRGYVNVTLHAATARTVLNYERHEQIGGWNVQPTTAQVLAACERHPGIYEAISHAQQATRVTSLQTSVGSALYYLFTWVDYAATSEFFGQLATGLGLGSETDPVYLLRRILLAPTHSGRNVSPRQNAAVTIKAFNLFMDGETIGQLRWRASGAYKEAFPKIKGLDVEALRKGRAASRTSTNH